MKALKILSLCLVLAGCASVKVAKEKTLATPKKGKGVVYFYRESAFVGSATSYNIWYNEANPKKIGSLKNGSYFYEYFDPGTYTFFINGEVRDVTKIKVEANKTYYVMNTINMGVWAARPKLMEVTEGEALSKIQDAKMDMTTLDETLARKSEMKPTP